MVGIPKPNTPAVTFHPLPSITILLRHSSTFCSSFLTHWHSWVENIKNKTQSLEQRAWQMLQLSTRTRKQVHQLSSSPNERTRSWGSNPFVFPPSLSSMWGRKKERSETQDLAAIHFATLECLSAFVPVITGKNVSIDRQLFLVFPVCAVITFSKEQKMLMQLS